MMKLKEYLDRWDHILYSEAADDRIKLYQEIVSGQYEGALKKMFSQLTSFQAFDWEETALAYFKSYPPLSFDLNEITFSFPAFLKEQAYAPHLIEIAEFEIAEFQSFTSKEATTQSQTLHLNPTNHFLHLQFDIPSMIKSAEKGKITIIQRPHILCLSRHPDGLLRFTELDQTAVQIIISLEEDRLIEDNLIMTEKEIFQKLVSQGVLIAKL